MSVFNLKIENPRSIPQETQQKTFKFVKSSKGQINFRAPPLPSWNTADAAF